MSIEVSVLFAMLSYFYYDTDHHDMYFLPYSFYDQDMMSAMQAMLKSASSHLFLDWTWVQKVYLL